MNPDKHEWVKPKLHTHRECGPRFHPLLHTSYIREVWSTFIHSIRDLGEHPGGKHRAKTRPNEMSFLNWIWNGVSRIHLAQDSDKWRNVLSTALSESCALLGCHAAWPLVKAAFMWLATSSEDVHDKVTLLFFYTFRAPSPPPVTQV
jgi:hypothetical protein